MKHFIVAIATALAILVPAGIAQAALGTAPVQKTYVDISVSSAFVSVVNSAENWVDTWTRTDMVNGACRAGYRCIKVRMAALNPSWAAYTISYSNKDALIQINTKGTLVGKYAYWSARLSALRHEFGHANGINWHNAKCTSVMYANLTCGSNLPPQSFLANEKTRLSVW